MGGNLFDSMDNLETLIDWTQITTIGRSWTESTVLNAFFTGHLDQSAFIYGSATMMLVMIFASAGYVITKAIDAGVSINKGFYAHYAYGTTWSNRMAFYEFIILGGMLFWGFLQPIIGSIIAQKVWDETDARLAEAAESSIGLEEAITMWKAIKASALILQV